MGNILLAGERVERDICSINEIQNQLKYKKKHQNNKFSFETIFLSSPPKKNWPVTNPPLACLFSIEKKLN